MLTLKCRGEELSTESVFIAGEGRFAFVKIEGCAAEIFVFNLRTSALICGQKRLMLRRFSRRSRLR